MESFEMICINCPLGCVLNVEKDNDNIKVSGNTCPRGEKYAIAEITHPTRTLTTTMAVEGGKGKYVSVKTNTPISKSKLFEAMAIINATKAKENVRAGDVIIPKIFGEADVIATSDAE